MMMKLKSKSLLMLALAGLLIGVGCENTNVSADETVEADEQAQKDEGFFAAVRQAVMPQTETIPAGSKIMIRLDQAISSDKNQSGDQFSATLASDLMANGKLLAPAGSKVIGELPMVDDSDQVKGRAEMQMTLRELVVGDSDYDLETHTLTIKAEGTEKEDAAVIAGSAAAGAIIGAISGGGKGAAIGAGVGGGAGTGYVLLTSGKEVEFGPEARFEFTLSDDLELPVYETDDR